MIGRLPMLIMLLLTGCSSVEYYAQSVRGQLDLMERRQPIEQLIADTGTPAGLRRQLELVLELRSFASTDLMLPGNQSYLSYADLEREAMVWNVVAAPEFSVQPQQWCYPLIGCASYRGYFSLPAAEAFAESLRQQGLEVVVEPIPAYSTLGWFDDPVPSTVIFWPAPRLAGLVFHELAHQQLYVPGDSAFNESFAETVQQVGVERWLLAQGSAVELVAWRLFLRRRDQFFDLLLATRERLTALYRSGQTAPEMRVGKAEVFQQLRNDYLSLKEDWEGYPGFDRWFEQAPLNNAHLVSVATYNKLTPAFFALLARRGGDVAAFYRACGQLAELPLQQRHARLLALVEKPQ